MREEVGIAIRPLTDFEEFRQVLEIQADAWGMPDVEIVPTHVLIAMAKNGGIVLGAFDEETGELVGFVFGFTGRREGYLYHYSHMLGVRRAYQGRGIGFKLKLAQREAALKSGLNLMRWTFDPLQRSNSRLNLGKLGAICRTYHRSYYGQMEDEINRELGSDRFEVEWHLDSPRVAKRISAPTRPPHPTELLERGAEVLLDSRPESDDFRSPLPAGSEPGSDLALVEIPWDINELRKRGRTDLIAKWRAATADAFDSLFGKGYVDVDLAVDRESKRCFHVLWKAPLEEILSRASLT